MNKTFFDAVNYITPVSDFREKYETERPKVLSKIIAFVKEAEEKNAEQAFILFQQEQIKELVDALQSLYDLQNGSPLPSYDKDYEKAMNESSRVLGYWQKFYSGE
jgi:hypothetical protein